MYSVVIPTYNSTQTIRRTIESVLRQTIPPKRIYIVDDVSEDLTLLRNILSVYGELISLIENIEKTNAANNRNKGWEMVEEEFVFFIDSDDEWMPFHVEEIMKVFCHEKHIDCVSTAFLTKQTNGNLLVCNSAEIDMAKIDNPLDLLFTGKFDFRSSCLSLKTEIYKKVKFDCTLNKHQDWDIFLSLVTNGLAIGRVIKPTVQINEVGNNRMSAKNNLEASFYFIDKWKSYQNEFNFNRLFRMLYVSAYKNDAKQEIKLLNNYMNKINRNLAILPMKLFSLISQSSFFLSKTMLLIFLWVKALCK